MGTINPATVSDGETIDASDLNNPINTIANEINGNLDNNNIASNAAIETSKLANSSVWADWTPDISAFGTLGNGSVDGRYIRIGNMVHGWAIFTLGSTSAVSPGFSFTFPVAPHADVYGNSLSIGNAFAQDASAGDKYGMVSASSATRMRPVFENISAGTYGVWDPMDSGVPFTWANGDSISIMFTYEAA